MSDISLPWGGDVQADETGDILCVDGADEIAQRLVRRVLTNPYIKNQAAGVVSTADYVFEPDYGGGLRAYVDVSMSPDVAKAITNRIKDQMRYESGIDMTVSPTVVTRNSAQGKVIINVTVATPSGQLLPLPQMELP